MYDELVERLHQRIALTHAGSPLQDDLREAAGAIEELSHEYEKLAEDFNGAVELLHKREKPRWIPATERLPEEDGCYLVAVKNDHQRRYSKTAWFSHSSWFARQDVTHWMPLPQPPKEDKP